MNWNCLHKWTLIFNLGLKFKYSFAATIDELFYKTFKYVVKYLKPLNLHTLISRQWKVGNYWNSCSTSLTYVWSVVLGWWSEFVSMVTAQRVSQKLKCMEPRVLSSWVMTGSGLGKRLHQLQNQSHFMYSSTTWPTRQATESEKFWNPELPPKASPAGRVMLIPFKGGQWCCPGKAWDQLRRKLLPCCPCCPNSPSCKDCHFHLTIQQRPHCQEDMGAVLSWSRGVTGGHLSCHYQSLQSSCVFQPGFSKTFGS